MLIATFGDGPGSGCFEEFQDSFVARPWVASARGLGVEQTKRTDFEDAFCLDPDLPGLNPATLSAI